MQNLVNIEVVIVRVGVRPTFSLHVESRPKLLPQLAILAEPLGNGGS
jgi:hypothetical protein